MRNILLCFCVLIILVQSAYAQSTHHPVISVSSGDAGLVPERLARIDRALQEATDKGWMNGCVAMIIHDGKIGYYKNFGYNDLETKKPLPLDGIFRIASQTKAITSVAVMMLFEEGKFLLDDAVSNYIPEFKNQTVIDKFNFADTTYTSVPAKREVTIRDLLTHTSGIGYAQIGIPMQSAIYAKSKILCGLGYEKHVLGPDIRKLAKIPLMHEPGEKFTYGLNVDVLGYLVEVVSGMSLNEFFQTKIFQPLAMKDTYFYLPAEKYDRLVNLYLVDEKGGLKKSPGYFKENGITFKDYPKEKGTYYAGGAGLSSTVMDYAIFLQMMLNDGEYNGKRILSRNTVRMMTTNQIGDLDLATYKFGLGFRIATEKSSALFPTPAGTYNWGGAFSTTYWVDPKEKIIGLMYRQLWNDQHEDEVINKFKVLVYQALAD